MNTLGIDLSSRAVDLVLLDENEQRASWTRVDLEGATAFERTRDVAQKMPQPGWYEAHGVYLCAIEEPVGFQSRVLYRVQGAILACLPDVPVWELRPATWKNALGIKQTEKPAIGSFPGFRFEVDALGWWPQDAYDALGVALYARDTNARAVARTLETIRQKTDRCEVCGEPRINVGAHAEACRGPLREAR